MRQFIALLGLLIATFCAAQTAPVATISFDTDTNGATAAGVLAGEADGKPVLVPGRTGQALKSGPGTGYVWFPSSVLKAESGTVEMWVQPLDWEPSQREFHVFFDTHGEGALYLYKYLDGHNLLMLSCESTQGPYYSAPFGLNWKPGEWHHIAGTWSSRGVHVFVDGKPGTPQPVECALPRKLGDRFCIGDHPWHIERTTSSLIDEVRVYDRALSPQHIAAHAEGNHDFVAPLAAETCTLTHDLDAVLGEATLRFGTGGADVPDEALRVKLALVPRGQAIGEAPELVVVGGEASRTVPLDMGKPGEHEVVAQVLREGREAFELREELLVPDTAAWLNSPLGLEDKVLPPWTPVTTDGATVEVWGREYDLSGSDLARQITSGGESLLTGPARIVAARGGVSVPVALSPEAEPTASGTAALVTRRGTADGLDLSIATRIEYDGLAWFELAGTVPDSLTGLSIEIPVRPEIAMYRHRYSPEWDTSKHTGLLPQGEGVIDSDHFIPYYWLGNNDRGLFWLCESEQMWPNGRAANAVEVVRGADGTVTLRLNILAQGQKLPEGWKLAFGLQATPVKPVAKDWRKWRLQPGRNGNVSILWPTPQKDSIKYFGYPEAADPALYAQRIAALHEQKVNAVPYLCLSFLSGASPEFRAYRRYWAMGPVDSGSSDVAAYGVGFAMASPVGKGYSDFIVSKTAQFIDQFGIDGLYHDNTHPYASSNLDAGCGYLRDGKPAPTHPLLGYRALYRRMYSVLKGRPGETFSMAHMSGKVTIPILAYEDSYLDGEQFRARVKDSYMDMFSLDTFRAEFMGRQWGIMPYFLPEFDAEHAAQIEPTRGLMALLMLHDTAVWPIWCNADVVNEALAALDEFGYVDADFTGYFDNPSPASTDMQDVYVSAYRRADGKALLIVGNLSREDREGKVTLNAAYFQGATGRALDWPSKQPIGAQDGVLDLAVPRLGYRMVLVE